jgi:predicted lipoprotein with Yx(FWY)xxD motif
MKKRVQIMRSLILAAAMLATAIPLAHADDYAVGAIKSSDTAKGEVLTNPKGMTLYTFDKDASGKSNCYDQCAAKWPPLTAASGAKADGDYTWVKRKEGSMRRA